jgi:hypothetical protein
MSLISDLLKLIVIFAAFLGLSEYILVSGLPNTKEKEHQVPARFDKVNDLVLEYRSNHTWEGTVYRDRETQIEYLYIWDGSGPAITRLWKKGE